MTYTRAEWGRGMLQAAGNTQPNPKILEWLTAWTRFETAPGVGAAYNLLNTIQWAPGATRFNTAGVRNFVSFEQGTTVNAQVLANGFYPVLCRALVGNDEKALGIGSAAPDAAINGELSIWGTGPRAAAILASLGQGMNDIFPGSGPASADSIYVVQAGDTLSGIARRLGIKDWELLFRRNRAIIGPDPNRIYPGQRLDYAGLV